ncbi:hypothetical protein GCM10011351_12750 [Paraliobacillus quinghaiensis]|uniref:Uncharacterized protein n=1 Tax=Paraliobacillus quinghaiensis TaxID=470815 RepID=A0A917WTW8_9BACI|nr:hypothetical protein [Paraliobacillus quinghaiensis]GGM28282.1 hypothetical protein GCM10011351_12750 [Paraliobacillus quinghaiensis]
MNEKINVARCDMLRFASEDRIADWVSEKEDKGDQFIQRVAETVNEFFNKQEK